MMPERVQLSRKKGWRKPEGALVVARPSRWGNPWKVTPWSPEPGVRIWSLWNVRTGATKSQHETQADAVRSAVRLFRADLEREIAQGLVDVSPLAGKDLACWCPDGQPCHADILLAFANGQVMQRLLALEQGNRRITAVGDIIRLGDGSLDVTLRHPYRIEVRREAG